MMHDFIREGTPALSTSHNYHLDMVENGGYVYFADMTAINVVMAENCNLAVMKEKFPLSYMRLEHRIIPCSEICFLNGK